MKTFTIKQIQKDIGPLMSTVAKETQPVIIKDGKDKVAVIMSMAEFRSWKETVFLLSSPRNAKRLRETLAEMDRYVYGAARNGR